MIAELDKVIPIWPKISNILSVPHTEKHYQKLVAILDALIDEIADNEEHPLANLMETIGNLVHTYETEQKLLEDTDPVTVLKELMIEHSLTQKDLSDIASQGVVSEILSGKRNLNVRQIKTLSEKFSVSPATFL